MTIKSMTLDWIWIPDKEKKKNAIKDIIGTLVKFEYGLHIRYDIVLMLNFPNVIVVQ